MSEAGELLGIASGLLAVAMVVLWFRRVFAVQIPEDRTVWVITFGAAAALGIASFAAGNDGFSAVAAGFGLGIGGCERPGAACRHCSGRPGRRRAIHRKDPRRHDGTRVLDAAGRVSSRL